jgi:hypothetical protein
VDDVRKINKAGWNASVSAGDIPARPVSPGEIARARGGVTARHALPGAN